MHGFTAQDISEELGVKLHAIKAAIREDKWMERRAALKEEAKRAVETVILNDQIEMTKKIVDHLQPVLNELAQQALVILQEQRKEKHLEPKDVLKFFHDYAKLTGQFTGEFKESKAIEFNANAAFEKIYNEGKDVIDMSKLEAEVLEEPKLIE